MNRHRLNYNNMYRDNYQGMMESMPRMNRDFHGRYYDNYGRWNDYDHDYGRSMFHYGPYMDDHSYGGWMDFPERWMDLSGYQMDMQGGWMNTDGHYVEPFYHGRNYSYSYYNHYFSRQIDYPERYMDMFDHQMDMQGRWMDNFDRNYYDYHIC